MSMASEIRKLHAKGMSREAIAERVGCAPDYVYKAAIQRSGDVRRQEIAQLALQREAEAARLADQGWSYRRIALQLNCSRNAVAGLVWRCRQRRAQNKRAAA